jgi:hypothetical protein
MPAGPICQSCAELGLERGFSSLVIFATEKRAGHPSSSRKPASADSQKRSSFPAVQAFLVLCVVGVSQSRKLVGLWGEPLSSARRDLSSNSASVQCREVLSFWSGR